MQIRDILSSFEKSLQSEVLAKSEHFTVRMLALQSGCEIKEHHSKVSAFLLVVQGNIRFIYTDDNTEINLSANEYLAIEKDRMHKVQAVENSRFLLIK